MGKYTGSPWGNIRGKIDDAVGGIWKGIDWVRLRVNPTQLGTITKYRLWKGDPTEPFSFPQFNIRRLVTQILGFIARTGSNTIDWIRPVWNELVEKRGYTMTGTNAFVRRNAAILFASMTNNNTEYDPTTNTIDLVKMLVSDGDLEPVNFYSVAFYDEITGDITLTWSPVVFKNGAGTDLTNVIVAKKPLLQMENEADKRLWNWRPNLFLYTRMKVAGSIRQHGSVFISIPAWLTYTDLYVYLFFKDEATGIGYSPSVCRQCVI